MIIFKNQFLLIIMNYFIEKNILIDNIIEYNIHLLSYPSVNLIEQFVELLEAMRENINLNYDEQILNQIIQIIDYNLENTEDLNEQFYDTNIIDEIIYGLNISKEKINEYLIKIASVDTLTDILEDININPNY
jgi:hypothetical protein